MEEAFNDGSRRLQVAELCTVDYLRLAGQSADQAAVVEINVCYSTSGT